MPLDIACSAKPRLKTALGGATRRAGTIGSGVLPHSEVRRLLDNWRRWAANWLPDLEPQQPPAFELYRAYNDPEFKLWDCAIPEPAPKINEAEAELIDKILCPTAQRLHKDHLMTLKRHYIGEVINGERHREPQPREKLDAAIRALGDVL
jgi:hypothetical protein